MSIERDKALLAFSLGPVQSFIAAARTVRDLWTGSYLLAWLTRQAMQPILEECGDGAFLSPAVEGNRAMDFRAQNLPSPCLPNRFTAIVPANRANAIAQLCRDGCTNAWRDVHTAVRERIGRAFEEHVPDWLGAWRESVERRWDAQTKAFFDVRTTILPLAECTDSALSELLHSERRARDGTPDERHWADCLEVLGSLQAAGKAIRQVPDYRAVPDARQRVPVKCALLGTFEQMGPADLNESARFWEAFAEYVHFGGSRLRKRERLSALSLVKRFAWPARLAGLARTNPRAMRLADTATVAAEFWLRAQPDRGSPELDPDKVRRQHGDWSGQWLHWTRPRQDDEEEACPEPVWQIIQEKRRRQGKPTTYYAIVMLDGDRMGERLRGSVARQQQISLALSEFALERVPAVVEDAGIGGTPIYSGGDDALAMLPTSTALACTSQLTTKFIEVWKQRVSTADVATVRAGLVVVHYKEDLRFALETVRRAEKKAKESGSDVLMITVCRRSGEHTSALCPWSFVDTVAGWVTAFLPDGDKPGASDRWAYHLFAELPTLKGVDDVAAMRAEIQRQVNRSEKATRDRLIAAAPRGPESDKQPDSAGDLVASQFDAVRDQFRGRTLNDAALLTNFITLCQTASFLARGRDE